MEVKKLVKITLLCLSVSVLPINAQVTIGLDEKPANGALLQMKEMGGVTNEVENSTKGMMFPRVKLTVKDKLYPMLANADGTTPADNYNTPAKVEAMDKLHVGLTVYNTNSSVPFKKGLYTWNGTEWKDYGGDIQAQNGISNNALNQSIELGGALTKSTTITQGANSLTFDAGTSAFAVSTANNSFVVKDEGVAIGGATKSNAILKLDATDKGLVLPRVELANGTDYTTVPVAAADKGLVVYHTGNTNLDEGIYSWNGIAWNQLIAQLPPDKEPNIRELKSESTLPAVAGSESMSSMVLLPFEDIIVQEPGSYVFMVRVAGKGAGSTYVGNDIPVFLYIKKTDTNGVLSDWIDGQTCYCPYLRTNGSTGGVATLVVPKCLPGESIHIYGARYNTNTSPITLYSGKAPKSSRTSVIYWKI